MEQFLKTLYKSLNDHRRQHTNHMSHIKSISQKVCIVYIYLGLYIYIQPTFRIRIRFIAK